jgi:hypothetical protein
MKQLFYAYAVQDVRYRDQLEKQLAVLRQQGVLSGWHARAVAPTTEWRGEVSPHVERADVVVLLVSGDFVASDYCRGPEVRRAVARHEQGEARVIPVLLRPCQWQDTPFAALPASPRGGKPVSRWSNLAAAFEAVAVDITGGRGVSSTNGPARTATAHTDSPSSAQSVPAATPAAAVAAGESGAGTPAVAAMAPAATAKPEHVNGAATATSGVSVTSQAAAGAAGSVTGGVTAQEPAPSQVALDPAELGPGYVALQAPAAPSQGRPADGSGTQFVSLAGAGARRVAQLVYRTDSGRTAVSRMEAAARSELAKGGVRAPLPKSLPAGQAIRRPGAKGQPASTVSVFAAKRHFLVGAKVIDGQAGSDAESDPMGLATSVVERMLARIPVADEG